MTDLTWKTEKRKVSDLLKSEINPRKIKPEKLKALEDSLNKFNLAEIPVINTDNTLITGNQRVTVLGMIGRGDEKIDVRVPSRQLTEQEAKEYMLIGNTHAGEFDLDLLELHFDDIEIEFDLKLIDINENKVKSVNAKDELEGMPEFEPVENPFKIIINFETEKDRDMFHKEFQFKYTKRESRAWSLWWPFKDRDDLKSVKFENEK